LKSAGIRRLYITLSARKQHHRVPRDNRNTCPPVRPVSRRYGAFSKQINSLNMSIANETEESQHVDSEIF